MEDFWTWANGGYSQGLAVAATAYGLNLLSKKWRGMSKNSTDRIKQAALLLCAQALKAVTVLAVFGYFGWQLRELLTPDTPPTRADVFGIAFWTFWALLLFVRMLSHPFGSGETKQSPAPQQCHCSNAEARPSQSAHTPQDTVSRD